MNSFKVGTIVSHTNSIHKFFIILEDYKNGQYLVEDFEKNSLGVKEKFVFIGKYLVDVKGRRDYILEDILK